MWEFEGKATGRNASIGPREKTSNIARREQCRATNKDTKIQITKLNVLVATLQTGSQARKRPPG